MPKKCVILGYKSNYDACKKRKLNKENDHNAYTHIQHTTVYRFPSSVEEKQRWITAIPLIDRERVTTMKEPVPPGPERSCHPRNSPHPITIQTRASYPPQPRQDCLRLLEWLPQRPTLP